MNASRSFRRRGLIILALVALFTLAGFFLLPPLVKAQLEKRLSSELGRRVTVGHVRVNPFALALTLENFAIQERDDPAVFLGWQRLHVNFDALSSLRGEWVLSAVELAGFATRVRINADQSLNFSDLLAKFAPPPNPAPPQPARPVRIARLQVTNARIDLADASRSQPFATVLGPLTFDLTGFRTVSEHGAPYRFVATTEAGERMAWSGTLRAEPFLSAGELSLENIQLPKYAPYYAERLQAEVVSGTLSVRGRYLIDLTTLQRALKITDMAVQLRGLALRARPGDAPALELADLDVTGITADALTMKASAASVTLSGGRARIRREKDGTIDLVAMLQPPAKITPAPSAAPGATPPAPASPLPTAPAPLPDVTLANVALRDFQIELDDLAVPRPAHFALSAIEATLANVTLAPGARIPLRVGFNWALRGTVQLEGDVVLSPLQADLKIDVADFDLLPLSPYLEQFAQARFTQGAVTLALTTHLELPTGQPPIVTIAGDVTVDKLGLVDAAGNEELAGFGQLSLRGIKAGADPKAGASLDSLAIVAPYLRVVVNADKSLNLATLAVNAPTVAAATEQPGATPSSPARAPGTAASGIPAASAPAPLPPINVGKITITDGDFRFTDRSIEPNVRMAINRFGGTITGLSSTSPAKADVDLKAAVDGAGPVSITGKADPLGPRAAVDLKIDLKNVDLQPLSAYSGRYAGYELARGKLALDVKVLVDGKSIDAANVITLHQLTFGAPVRSAEATSLPVRLGVALLKDPDGKIVIDVPVQGNTDDPDFQIGRVVLRVIVNLLTKAAVSPFALLASAFGGSGEELAYQQFAPGSTALQAAEAAKLNTMVQALTNRPALSVALEGGYDAAADAYALQRVKLADRIRSTVGETRHRADPTIPSSAQLEISPAEHAAALRQLYDAQFPAGTQFGTPLPPPPAVVAPPAPPAGFFRRVVRLLTGAAKREERAAARENARLTAEHQQAIAAARAGGRPVEEMTGRLAEATAVDDNDLRALAQARAEQVRDYFLVTGKIAADRIFLANARPDPNTPSPPEVPGTGPGKGPRVFLHLQ